MLWIDKSQQNAILVINNNGGIMFKLYSLSFIAMLAIGMTSIQAMEQSTSIQTRDNKIIRLSAEQYNIITKHCNNPAVLKAFDAIDIQMALPIIHCLHEGNYTSALESFKQLGRHKASVRVILHTLGYTLEKPSKLVIPTTTPTPLSTEHTKASKWRSAALPLLQPLKKIYNACKQTIAIANTYPKTAIYATGFLTCLGCITLYSSLYRIKQI